MDAHSYSWDKGTLVRCQSSGHAWIGEVAGVEGNSLRVKPFPLGPAQRSVPRTQATPLRNYLHQHPRPRKLKTIYAEFFGRVYQLIPGERLADLQGVLRRHQVKFDKSRTRADDFYPLRMDEAVAAGPERVRRANAAAVPEVIAAWLPKWLVSDSLPPSSRDPLGLQADAERLAGRLLPGMTVFTNRVGYFFFLAWALRELNGRRDLPTTERREILNRMERALVLCETLYHGTGGLVDCRHQGQRSKERLLREAGSAAFIPERILKNQNSTGGYGLYRTPLRSCGVWEDDDEAGSEGRLPFRLTSRGERMAEVFSRRSGAKELLSWAVAPTRRRDVSLLRRWGKSLCFCTFRGERSEKKLFLDGFLFAIDDSLQVAQDAATRLATVSALDRAGLLDRPEDRGASPTLISTETTDADLTEADVLGGSLNVSFLMHYYRNRREEGAAPFVAACVYELLGLALNAVWAELLGHVADHGRVSIGAWAGAIARESGEEAFWSGGSGRREAVSHKRESALVRELLKPTRMAENGLILATKVLFKKENVVVLHDQLPNTQLGDLVERTVLAGLQKPGEAMLAQLALALLEHHRRVSEGKGRELWLQTDGIEAWAVDSREMALGFHSYRMPQLVSLMRDLQLKSGDFTHA